MLILIKMTKYCKNETRLGLKSQELSPYFKTKVRVLAVIFLDVVLYK